eukprot:ANDGO_01866.mRNA.1 hypothetical protein
MMQDEKVLLRAFSFLDVWTRARISLTCKSWFVASSTAAPVHITTVDILDSVREKLVLKGLYRCFDHVVARRAAWVWWNSLPFHDRPSDTEQDSSAPSSDVWRNIGRSELGIAFLSADGRIPHEVIGFLDARGAEGPWTLVIQFATTFQLSVLNLCLDPRVRSLTIVLKNLASLHHMEELTAYEQTLRVVVEECVASEFERSVLDMYPTFPVAAMKVVVDSCEFGRPLKLASFHRGYLDLLCHVRKTCIAERPLLVDCAGIRDLVLDGGSEPWYRLANTDSIHYLRIMNCAESMDSNVAHFTQLLQLSVHLSTAMLGRDFVIPFLPHLRYLEVTTAGYPEPGSSGGAVRAVDAEDGDDDSEGAGPYPYRVALVGAPRLCVAWIPSADIVHAYRTFFDPWLRLFPEDLSTEDADRPLLIDLTKLIGCMDSSGRIFGPGVPHLGSHSLNDVSGSIVRVNDRALLAYRRTLRSLAPAGVINEDNFEVSDQLHAEFSNADSRDGQSASVSCLGFSCSLM